MKDAYSPSGKIRPPRLRRSASRWLVPSMVKSYTVSEKKRSPELICDVCNKEIDIQHDGFVALNDSESKFAHEKCRDQDKMPNQGTRLKPDDVKPDDVK